MWMISFGLGYLGSEGAGPAGPKGWRHAPGTGVPALASLPHPAPTTQPLPAQRHWELGLYRRCALLPPACSPAHTRTRTGLCWPCAVAACCSSTRPPPVIPAVPPRAAAAHVTPLLPLAGGDGERPEEQKAAGALPEVPRAGGAVHHRDPRDHGEGLQSLRCRPPPHFHALCHSAKRAAGLLTVLRCGMQDYIQGRPRRNSGGSDGQRTRRVAHRGRSSHCFRAAARGVGGGRSITMKFGRARM